MFQYQVASLSFSEMVAVETFMTITAVCFSILFIISCWLAAKYITEKHIIELINLRSEFILEVSLSTLSSNESKESPTMHEGK